MSTSLHQAMTSSTRPQIIPPSSDPDRAHQSSTSSNQIANIRSPISTIAVLPSSLPDYHKAYMKGHPKPLPAIVEPTGPPQNEEERAAQARRLRPNFRAVQETSRQRPEPMTSLPAKKPRPTKWQFGIRSRNQPAEAMLAIYKALKAMDAEWEAPNIRRAGGSVSRSRSGSGERERSRSRSVARSRGSSISSHSSQDEDRMARSDRSASPDFREPLSVRNPSTDGHSSPSRGRQRKHYNQHNDWGYKISEDPWVINARFRKDGMFPPGVAHPSSTHSSRVDLSQDPVNLRRRSSTTMSQSSSNHVEGMSASDPPPAASVADSNSDLYAGADEAVYIYMSIQLYSIERDFFVVDFKCAGYERLVNNLVREIKATSTSNTSISNLALSQNRSQYQDGWDDEQGVWRRLGEGEPLPAELARELREGGHGVLRERTEEVGAGRAQEEKRATSPFPFLDIASSLILQLSGE
jgi:carbon catabolite-derepressing protein kinase